MLGGLRLSGSKIDMNAVEIQEGKLSAENFSKNGISINPNPLSDSRFFTNNNYASTASIFDISGKLVKTIFLEKGFTTINISLEK